MKVLWEWDEPISTQTINKALAHKLWKRTTISTMLSRLVEKGVISSTKQGNSYFYTPLISDKDYRKEQTRNLISNLYNNSVKEFAVSLFEDDTLSQEEITEFKKMFDI